MVKNSAKIALRALSNPIKSKLFQKFFKTGPGQYGEGDLFLGLSVPQTRKVASNYIDLPLQELNGLLDSKYHEERLCALIILSLKYSKYPDLRKEIFDFYIANTKNINNWDLVDVSAPRIVGHYLSDKKNKSILYKLSKSNNLWEKRISIISTLYFINKQNQFEDTINIAEILMNDKHDLIQKAVGWMLREVGKQDIKVLETFLKKYYKSMPRTMLRYSIEKFPQEVREMYLKGKI